MAQKIADLICEHKTELRILILDAYDKRYVHSKGHTLPQEVRDAWADSVIDEAICDLRGTPNPRAFEICGGDMVIQHEKSLNSFVTYLENELFSARLIGTFLWRHWVADRELLKAGIAALEASTRASIKANTATFIEDLCTPGTISTILSLNTPSGPDFEAASIGTAKPQKSDSTPSLCPELTQREQEILGLIVEGLSNKEIAVRLGIGLNTVKHHISRIFDKYAVQSRTALVSRALKEPGGISERSAMA